MQTRLPSSGAASCGLRASRVDGGDGNARRRSSAVAAAAAAAAPLFSLALKQRARSAALHWRARPPASKPSARCPNPPPSLSPSTTTLNAQYVGSPRQVAGYAVHYKGLTYATVKGAGARASARALSAQELWGQEGRREGVAAVKNA